MSSKTEAFPFFSEYVKASTDALTLLSTLYPLLPTGGEEVEAKILAAQDALQKANVELARIWDYQLHDCTFPPQIMLYDPSIRERVCPHCKYQTRHNTSLPDTANRGPGGSWTGARRG